jgi:hypothetical protein
MAAAASDEITTEELIAATETTRDALYAWVAYKLLPRPTIATRAGAAIAMWPRESLERALFIQRHLESHSLEQIAALLRKRRHA